MTQHRSSALVVRVWLDDSPAAPGAAAFRARLIAVDTATHGEDRDYTVAVCSSVGDTVIALREWLDEVVARGTPED